MYEAGLIEGALLRGAGEFAAAVIHASPRDLADYLRRQKRIGEAEADLLGRPDLIEPLVRAVGLLMCEGDSQSQDEAFEWVAKVLLFGPRDRWYAEGQIHRICVRGEKLIGPAEPRRDLLRRCVDLLRSESPDEIPRARQSWLELLIQYADVLFESGKPEEAIRVYDEAWRIIPRLRPTPFVLKAMNRLVVRRSSAVKHESERFKAKHYAESLDMIAEARERVLEFAELDESRDMHLLQFAIAEAEVWRARRRIHECGIITSAEESVRCLEAGLLSVGVRRASGEPDLFVQVAAIIDSNRNEALARALGRALRLLAEELRFIGKVDQMELAGELARAASTPQTYNWWGAARLQIGTARDLQQKNALCEQLLRDIKDHGFASFRPNQAANIRRNCEDVFVEHASDLFQAKYPMAGKFWRYQASQLRSSDDDTEPEAVLASLEGPTETDSDSDSVNAGIQDQLPDLVALYRDRDRAPAYTQGRGLSVQDAARLISEENPLAVVLNLRNLSRIAPEYWSGFWGQESRQAFQLFNAWLPPRRQRSQALNAAPDCLPAFRERCLELALDFAEVYTPHLCLELTIQLSELSSKPLAERLALTLRAKDYAQVAGDLRGELRCLRAAVHLAHSLNDKAACEKYALDAVADAHTFVRRIRGGVGLVEVSKMASQVLNALAYELASLGYERVAFNVARASVGWLSAGLGSDSKILSEFECFERSKAKGPGSPDTMELYELMLDRVLDGDAGEVKAPMIFTLGWKPPVQTVAVQILPAPTAGAVRAICAVTDADGRTAHFSTPLGLNNTRLLSLADRVQADVEPVDDGEEGPWERSAALSKLHVFLSPLLQRLSEHRVESIVFCLHGSASGLPLHAARGKDGYLIERYRVSYEMALDQPDIETGMVTSTRAFVGGWDPAIGALQEAQTVADILRRYGLEITPHTAAREAKADLLASEPERLSILHLVAHGDFQAWPYSLQSRLRFTRHVSVTAAEWLAKGGRASLVFLNACNIARFVPHAGDRNGFPLALKVRGCSTVVAALGPIRSFEAHRFAQEFYTAMADHDSVGAFQQSAVAAIQRGEPESGWAPYAHYGPAVVLPRMTVRSKQSSRARAASSKKKKKGRR